ncbi:Hypothetical predicted protein, partial [Pelobates cultripes]
PSSTPCEDGRGQEVKSHPLLSSHMEHLHSVCEWCTLADNCSNQSTVCADPLFEKRTRAQQQLLLNACVVNDIPDTI